MIAVSVDVTFAVTKQSLARWAQLELMWCVSDPHDSLSDIEFGV